MIVTSQRRPHSYLFVNFTNELLSIVSDVNGSLSIGVAELK